MPRSCLTIIFLLSFLVTTTALQWMQIPQYPMQVWIVLGVAASVSLIFSFRTNVGRIVLCVVLGAGIAFLRVGQTTRITTLNNIEAYAIGEEVTLRGFIVDEPDRRPMKTKYTIEVNEINTASGYVFLVSGKVLATDNDQWPPHAYGDEVVVKGVLELPGQIEKFHYDRYLSRYGIYSVIYRAKIETLRDGHGNAIFAFLYDLKEKFESQINRLYPEPHASFMAGLLTGSRRGIPDHLLEDFQTTGLTHIIAISGYNITIVMTAVAWCMFFVPLRWRFIPSVLAIAFFTMFVGASPSVVRAAIMGSLGLFALQTGRMQHSFIAVLLTAFLMTAWNPKMLWYDAGFQLSFLAVLGLVFIGPIIEPYLKRVPQMFSFREALQMTIAAQLTAVPLIVVLFGHFSVVAPLANVLVAFLIPLGMLFGFAGTVVSFFLFPLGQFIAYIGWGMLELIIFVAQTLSEVPYALLQVGDMGTWGVTLYYVFLLCIIYVWNRKFTTYKQKSSVPLA